MSHGGRSVGHSVPRLLGRTHSSSTLFEDHKDFSPVSGGFPRQHSDGPESLLSRPWDGGARVSSRAAPKLARHLPALADLRLEARTFLAPTASTEAAYTSPRPGSEPSQQGGLRQSRRRTASTGRLDPVPAVPAGRGGYPADPRRPCGMPLAPAPALDATVVATSPTRSLARWSPQASGAGIVGRLRQRVGVAQQQPVESVAIPADLAASGSQASQSDSSSERHSSGSPRDAPVSIQGKAWQCGHRLGEGSYGCVYKAICPEAGLVFAVKKAHLDECNPDHCRFKARLEEELKICSSLKHPNIISYLGHEYQQGTLCIFLEYAAGGSMACHLKEFGPLAGTALRSCSKGLLEGLAYLHSCSPPVVHRDVKGANLLLDLNMNVRLADFGCSKRDDVTQSFTTIGSIPWMAPEVIRQEHGHGRKADVWSAACTIVEMATAERPWGNNMFDNPMFALAHISMSGAVPPVPAVVPDACGDLLKGCLCRDPRERPTASKLLRHPWFKRESPTRRSEDMPPQ